jgi:DNA repair exonuclease SbcCD ATPase subunit
LQLWKEYSKEEIKTTIIEYRQIIKDLEKLNEYQNNLERYKVDEDDLKKNINKLEDSKRELDTKKKILDKLEMQKEIFKCPSCKVDLKFQNNKLEVFGDTIYSSINEEENINTVTEDISKEESKISKLENLINLNRNKLERYKEVKQNINNITEQYEEVPNLIEIKDDLEYIIEYRSSGQELEKQLSKLKYQVENQKYSSTISSFKESLEEQKDKIDILHKFSKNYEDTEINEEELRQYIIIQKSNKEKLEKITLDINNLKLEKLEIEKQILNYKDNHLEKYKIIREKDIIQTELDEQIAELEKLENKKIEHEKNIQNIEKYQEYEKNLETYLSWVNKIEILKKQEIEHRKEYGAATLLKEKILEAESIAMLNIISSINTHSHTYLESFFPDNPITIKLVSFKETKKGKEIKKKPQINLLIDYKGMEADLSMLSGGELSRVILAFSLALGEMFNTPMMMLDECTSSLDQELTGTVIDGIRENFLGKIVLVIAHQITKGGFDKVIEIGE